jgi:hypothetical protein
MIINSDACHADDIITACDFARTLEVELADLAVALEEVKRLKKLGMDGVDREEKLERDLAAARKALKFYASVENYNLESTTFGVFDDRGAQARAALDAAKEDKV